MNSHRKRTQPHPSSAHLSAFNELLWAVIGLLLTIISTFVEVVVTNPPWEWFNDGLRSQHLGITYQIGAALLTGCAGGKNAGALSQIAYILLGLFGLPVFARGGGLGYLSEPSFGYLIGFVLGAWVCGWLAFRKRPTIEWFAFSSFCGLLVIHFCGLIYLLGFFLFQPLGTWTSHLEMFWTSVYNYSLTPFLGQLVIICVGSILAFIFRKILLY